MVFLFFQNYLDKNMVLIKINNFKSFIQILISKYPNLFFKKISKNIYFDIINDSINFNNEKIIYNNNNNNNEKIIYNNNNNNEKIIYNNNNEKINNEKIILNEKNNYSSILLFDESFDSKNDSLKIFENNNKENNKDSIEIENNSKFIKNLKIYIRKFNRNSKYQ
jgi:hypothetical protein